MAAHLIVASLVALVCIAQPGFSRPEQAAGPNIQELMKEMQTTMQKTVDDMKKYFDLPKDPNGEAIVKAMREQTQKAEAAFKDMKAKVEKEVKSNPQLQEVMKNLEAKLDEASKNMKKENPELAANVQKAVDNVKSSYDSVVKEMEKINAEVNKKGGLRDDFETLMKNLIDRGSAAAKEMQAKIQEAINKKN